jgi:hypothetical protein
MLAVVVAAAVSLAAHNNSDGASRFTVAQDGTVDITLDLLAVDVPELCGFTLPPNTTSSPQLDRCVQRLSSWLRIRTDDDACAIDGASWSTDDLELTIRGIAHCDRPAGHHLVIHWGLFAGQDLEHVNAATIVLPDASHQRVLFSRRHNKATIAVADPRGARAAVAFAIVAGATAVTLAGWWSRQRRRRSSSEQ